MIKHTPATPPSRCTRNVVAKIGRYECDVWPTGEGARYSVLDTVTGRYVKGGQCASVEWAKQVSAGFARSLIEYWKAI